MKWLIRLGVLAILLVVVIAAAVFLMIDSIATTAVREGAAFATQTDVELEKVDVKVFDTAGEIIRLDISNPEDGFLEAIKGFTEEEQKEYAEAFDSFLVLGSGSAEISAASLLSDTIEIPKVELSDIEISLIGKDGKKNYEVILEALKRFQGDEPPAETEGQKQVVINELIIRNITVYYYFDEDPALGAIAVGPKKIVIADDEPMVLTDVGTGGVPISQITADIITDVLVQVMANMAGDLGGHMKGLANSLVSTIGEVELGKTLEELDLGGNLEALGDLGLDIGELGIDAVEGIGEGISEGAGDLIRGITGGGDSEDGNDDSEEGGSLLDDLSPF